MSISRRRLLQVLAAAGITGPAAGQLLAQARHRLTIESLRGAGAVLDRDLDDERLKVVEAALQRNLDQFQIVRELEIDDSIEPAIIFDPTRH